MGTKKMHNGYAEKMRRQELGDKKWGKRGKDSRTFKRMKR